MYAILQSSFSAEYVKTVKDRKLHILENTVPDDLATWHSPYTDALYMNLTLSQDFGTMIEMIGIITPDTCNAMLEDKKLMDNVRNINFDMTFVDCFYLNPCLTAVAIHLSLPFVCRTTWVESMIVRTPSLPSFVPALFTSYTDKMTFWERVTNAYTGLYYFWFDLPCRNGENDKAIMAKYTPQYKSMQELVRQALLHIQTRDHLCEAPDVTMPNVLMVPGVTANPPKPLPKQFDAVVNPKHGKGIILVAFSGYVNKFPINILEKMFDAYRQLPQTVLMRYTGNMDKIKSIVPENVHLFTWMPLNDLLGHKNTKAFVTHAGNNARYEAVYHGVPMVAMPFFADQPNNAQMIARRKFGFHLNINNFSSAELRDALEQVIADPIYRNNIKHLSDIMKDRPMSASDTAAFWIEHVMKFGGNHLRSYGYEMPWYQFAMLDIVGCLLLVEAFAILGLVVVCKKCCCKRDVAQKEKLS